MTHPDASERAREVAAGRPVWRDVVGVPFLEADRGRTSPPLRIVGKRPRRILEERP
jgi:hypothetical protein